MDYYVMKKIHKAMFGERDGTFKGNLHFKINLGSKVNLDPPE